jgi:putative RecB family exonuclease
VLEDLFDLPREQRTEEHAVADVPRACELVLTDQPDARFAIDAELAWPDDARPASDQARERFLEALPAFIGRYFVIEHPDTFDATHRERYVKGQIDDDLWLHGYVDRIDVAPTGDVRIVDYKTGKAPSPNFQDQALFQLKCYALLWQQEHDVPVRRLMMLFLGSGDRLVHDPKPIELERAKEHVRLVWASMKRANEAADWQPKPSKLCDWCSFQTRCPAKSSHVPRFEPVPLELPR